MFQKPKLTAQNQIVALFIPLALAVLARGILLTRWCGDFNSDEAIVGLMAKHILEGHFPVFFYGQFYMGSLEAVGAAAIFWLFGDMNGLLLRLSPVIFYLAFIIASFFWLDRGYNRSTAIWGALFLALPPALLMIYTYNANGGAIEMLFLGTLLFFLCQRALTSGWKANLVFAVGLIAGLAIWVHPLSVFYVATVIVIWVLSSTWWPRWRTYLLGLSLPIWLAIGISLLSAILVALFVLKLAVDVLYIQRLLIVGSIVVWVASITFLRWRNRLNSSENNNHHHELYAFWLGLGGIAGIAPMIYHFFINSGHSTGGRDDFNVVTWQRLLEVGRLQLSEIYPALIGLYTYDNSASAITLLAKVGIAALFAGIIFLFCKRYARPLLDIVLLRPIAPRPEHYTWLLSLFIIGFGFANGNNYDVQHIRYLLPLLLVLSTMVGIAFAQWQKSRPVAVAILALFLWGYYGLTNLHYYQTLPATCSAQEVVDFLESKHIKGGQAYYQQAYKLTFLSQEKVIVAPYNSRERYEAYSRYVATLPQRTFIFQAGDETESFLSEHENPTNFTIETISDFNIFSFADTSNVSLDESQNEADSPQTP